MLFCNSKFRSYDTSTKDYIILKGHKGADLRLRLLSDVTFLSMFIIIIKRLQII